MQAGVPSPRSPVHLAQPGHFVAHKVWGLASRRPIVGSHRSARVHYEIRLSSQCGARSHPLNWSRSAACRRRTLGRISQPRGRRHRRPQPTHCIKCEGRASLGGGLSDAPQPPHAKEARHTYKQTIPKPTLANAEQIILVGDSRTPESLPPPHRGSLAPTRPPTIVGSCHLAFEG